MSRRSNKEWERRKWYLIRSLFDDSPLLSPIPEVHEPSLHQRSISSSTSSLPDLVLEVEPNKHDEPEEYYREMEKKIMKFYKEIFSDKISAISSGNKRTDVPLEELGQMELSISDQIRKNLDSDKSDVDEPTGFVAAASMHQQERLSTMQEITFRSETAHGQSNTPSSDGTSPALKEIVIRADVHHPDTASDLDMDDTAAPTASIDTSPEEQEPTKSTVTTFSDARVSKSRETISHDTSQSDTSLPLDEPEIMRGTETSNTYADLTDAFHCERSMSPDVSAEEGIRYSKEMEEETPSNGSNVIFDWKESCKYKLYSALSTIPEVQEEVEEEVEAEEEFERISVSEGLSSRLHPSTEKKTNSHDDSAVYRKESCVSVETETSLQRTEQPGTMPEATLTSASVHGTGHPTSSPGISTAPEVIEARVDVHRAGVVGSAELEVDDASQEMDQEARTSAIANSSRECNTRKQVKRREIFRDEGRPSPKRSKRADAITQTSFSSSDDECDWEEIRGFFVGTPRVYKLCSCRRHVCC